MKTKEIRNERIEISLHIVTNPSRFSALIKQMRDKYQIPEITSDDIVFSYFKS
jgi:hypothetical protein